MQCFIIKSSVIRGAKDLLLFNVYIPPATSAYSNVTHFEELEHNVINQCYTEKMTLLCGDLNAHTGVSEDYLDAQYYDDLDDLDIKNVKEILSQKCCLERKSEDKRKVDCFGKKLLESVKSLGLCILNGRVNGDERGKSTTTHNSVIDYFIGSTDLLDIVHKLNIEDYDNLFSDVHCQLSLYLKCVEESNNPLICREQKRIGLWKKEKEEQFVRHIAEEALITIREELSSDDYNVDEIADSVANILTSAGEKNIWF